MTIFNTLMTAQRTLTASM
jgi:aquaporin rerated protein, other eukaryote